MSARDDAKRVQRLQPSLTPRPLWGGHRLKSCTDLKHPFFMYNILCSILILYTGWALIEYDCSSSHTNGTVPLTRVLLAKHIELLTTTVVIAIQRNFELQGKEISNPRELDAELHPTFSLIFHEQVKEAEETYKNLKF